jgi:diguanylate cyclase
VAELFSVLPWVLGSVVVGVGIGFYLGLTARPQKKQTDNRREAATLNVLSNVLAAAEQLNMDVGTHNTEIQAVGRHLTGLKVDESMREVQQTLLGEISSVLEANKQLEDDLTYARLRIEEQAQELDRTRREARTDPLSGVANRKGFDEKLQMMLGAYKRHGKRCVLALCDIDHFKWINDTHGHAAGDQVVTQVGKFLRDCLRGDDFVARFGGDEFALILANVDIEAGGSVAERIRASVSKHNFGLRVGEEQAAVTFSIGAAAPWDGATAETLLEHADRALYRAKEVGRNKVYCYRHPEGTVVPATGTVGQEAGIRNQEAGGRSQ